MNLLHKCNTQVLSVNLHAVVFPCVCVWDLSPSRG